MQTLWLPSPCPRRRTCPKQYLLKTCVHLLHYTRVCLGSTRSSQVRAGWIPYHYSWKKIYCLTRSPKLKKYEEKLIGFGCPRIESYTNALSLVPICFVYTPRHQNHFQRNSTKGFMGVIQEEDPCLIGLLPRNIGGQACKRRYRNTLRNAINVKGSRQIFTSLEEFSILFLALGHLLSGAWTLWDFSPKRQEIKNTYQSVQTILPSGLKLNLWLISGMQMSKDSFGRTLLHDSGFLTCSSRTMAFNLTAKLL